MIISLLAPRAEGNTRLGEFHLPGTDVSLATNPNLPRDSLGPELIAVSSVLTALSILAVGARLYTRAVLLGWVGVDDYFILLAEACAIANHVVTVKSVHVGVGSHIWTIDPSNPYTLAKLYYHNSVLYIATLWIMKASLLITLRRISVHSTRMRRAITVAFGLSIFFSFASFFVVVFQCVPITYGWRRARPGEDPGVGKCVHTAGMWYAVTSINIMMDFAIWVVPIVMVRQMRNLPLSKKAGMGVLFFLGGLAIMAAIARLATLKYTFSNEKPIKDPTYSGVGTVFCGVIEIHLAVIATSLPPVRPLIRKIFGSRIDHSSHNGNSNQGPDGPADPYSRRGGRGTAGYGYGRGINPESAFSGYSSSMEELTVIEQTQDVSDRGGTSDSKGSDIGIGTKATTAGIISAEQLSSSTLSQMEVKEETT